MRLIFPIGHMKIIASLVSLRLYSPASCVGSETSHVTGSEPDGAAQLHLIILGLLSPASNTPAVTRYSLYAVSSFATAPEGQFARGTIGFVGFATLNVSGGCTPLFSIGIPPNTTPFQAPLCPLTPPEGVTSTIVLPSVRRTLVALGNSQ